MDEDAQTRKTKAERAILEGLTGAAPTSRDDVAGMLQVLYGTTRTRRGDDGQLREVRAVDTREAARGFGVSQRTIQRWLKGASNPRREHKDKLVTRTRQAATTKRGRQRLANRARRNAPGRPIRVQIRSHQGPSDPSYKRDRTTRADLSPEAYEELLSAYAETGEEGMREYLAGYFSSGSTDYPTDWEFDDIQKIGFERL
ncbi:hypothetical protein [Microbacterium paludicola]|uniref:hypothetical protein n=1 Tax=Microbacterium paludicola TaxID=300019 RepID=UPI0031D26BB4